MLNQLQVKATALVVQNASAILTGVGVVGSIGTAVLAGRASVKAVEILREVDELHDAHREQNGSEYDNKPTTKMEMVQHTWPLFLPVVGAGAVTVTAIVMANHLSAKRAAALAAAYGLSERNFEEYKAKALETLGVNKEQKLQDEVAQDRVAKNENHQVIMVGEGDVLCFEPMTGRYFKSSVEKLSKAMAEVHSEIYKYNSCSFTYFCDEVGLEPSEMAAILGWNDKDIPDIHWSATTTSDDRPCLSIDFSPMPQPDYAAMYD